jgi:hypothetical protein
MIHVFRGPHRGRWWRWHGREIDLLSEAGHVPGIVRIACLAVRDAETEADSDMADFAVWLVEAHPPWDGGCTACGTPTACLVHRNAHPALTGWLIERAQRRIAQSRQVLDHWRQQHGV